MASKKKKQKFKQQNNAIPQNWIIKKNIKQNEIHKYYSNHDNIGDLTNRRIFVDMHLKEQEHQQKYQLTLKDRAVMRKFNKLIEHSKATLKTTTQKQIAGQHYINSLKHKSFNALLQNIQSNKEYYFEEKTPDLINHTKMNESQQKAEPQQNMISNFIGSVD